MYNDIDVNAFLIANYCKYYFDIDASSEEKLVQIEFVTDKGALIITKDIIKHGSFEDFKTLIGNNYKVVYPSIKLNNDQTVGDRNKNFAPGVIYIQ